MNHAKLNALVAERVMGWKWCEKFMHWYPPGPDVTLNDTRTKRDFDPSRNIAHAHEMRDKVLRENPEWYALTIVQHAVKHSVRIDGTVGQCDIGVGVHEQEPVAWCFAFLRALGVTDKEIEEVANG